MSDEQFSHLQLRVTVENNENACDMAVDRPMSPPPDEIVEAREMIEELPSLPESEATIPVSRRSARKERTRKVLQDRSSEPKVNKKKTKTGKVQKPRKCRSGKHVITCRKCGSSVICFPVRTKYFTCAEVDGQLFKVKQISAKVALNYVLKK